jgi:hypothetical protein
MENQLNTMGISTTPETQLSNSEVGDSPSLSDNHSSAIALLNSETGEFNTELAGCLAIPVILSGIFYAASKALLSNETPDLDIIIGSVIAAYIASSAILYLYCRRNSGANTNKKG